MGKSDGMSGKLQAQSVLIVSSSEKSGRVISGLLDSHLCRPVSIVKSGSEVRRDMMSFDYDLVIINAPLSDEFGHELAMDLAQRTMTGVLLLVKSDVYEQVMDQVTGAGVLTIQKPIVPLVFGQAVCLAAATRSRLKQFEKENSRLKLKLEEIRVVDRAKYVLMEYLNMGEAQAHRYIEKQAMDTRSTKKSVAESILKTYES